MAILIYILTFIRPCAINCCITTNQKPIRETLTRNPYMKPLHETLTRTTHCKNQQKNTHECKILDPDIPVV